MYFHEIPVDLEKVKNLVDSRREKNYQTQVNALTNIIRTGNSEIHLFGGVNLMIGISLFLLESQFSTDFVEKELPKAQLIQKKTIYEEASISTTEFPLTPKIKCSHEGCDFILFTDELRIARQLGMAPVCAFHHPDKCHGCEKIIISGKYLSVNHKKYHTSCFVCDSCDQPLSSKYYTFGSENICQNCSDAKVFNMQSEKQASLESLMTFLEESKEMEEEDEEFIRALEISKKDETHQMSDYSKKEEDEEEEFRRALKISKKEEDLRKMKEAHSMSDYSQNLENVHEFYEKSFLTEGDKRRDTYVDQGLFNPIALSKNERFNRHFMIEEDDDLQKAIQDSLKDF